MAASTDRQGCFSGLGSCPVPQDGGDGMTLCNCAQLDLYTWESVCKTLNKWKSEGGSRRPRG